MNSLITRLEKAEEGSRELSDECLLAVGWTLTKDTGPQRMYIAPDNSLPIHQIYAPDPSQNVQDAIDHMVPEGWYWGIDSRGIAHLDPAGTYPIMDGTPCFAEIQAATAAVALCIGGVKAALRARETEAEDV